MKKYLLMLVVAMVSLTASAQVYVGGKVGLWRNSDANHTSFNITPEIGYKLDKNLDLGIELGYNHNYNGSTQQINGETAAFTKTNAFTVAPYIRYSFVEYGPVSLFLDGTFGFATYKTTASVLGHETTGDAMNGWQIGVRPGVKVALSDKLGFVATCGFLGYRDSEDNQYYGESGFGFDLNATNLQFGLFYNF